jgi:hypothetical protein
MGPCRVTTRGRPDMRGSCTRHEARAGDADLTREQWVQLLEEELEALTEAYSRYFAEALDDNDLLHWLVPGTAPVARRSARPRRWGAVTSAFPTTALRI